MDIAAILSVVKQSLDVVQTMASAGENFIPALSIVNKGVTVANVLIAARQNVAPAITALANTFSGDKKTVTQDELDACEATLDALLDEFNTPLPPE